VTGLGDEKEGTKIGAAILLRTFLHPGYEQFYAQIFDLVVANLRLPRTAHQPEDPTAPLPMTPFSQALVTVFKESFPRVRERLKEENPRFSRESLDASRTQLDKAYLSRADLKQAWLPGSFLRGANLYMTDLRGADPSGADLRRANLEEADLSETWLSGANLSQANLKGADLSAAILNATRTFMTAYLGEMDLEAADLSGVDLKEANLKGANLSGVNLEEALSLTDTDLRQVIGLTKEQLVTCKAKGAIIDEDSTVSSSGSTVSPPPLSQSDDTQAQSSPSAKGSIPTPDTDGSSAAPSKSGPES
jgi:uncharacterized protein YjbI with pentapeptide repeats